MNAARLQGVILAVVLIVLGACSQQAGAAPAPPQTPNASFNLFKEISDRKGTIQWNNAPPDAIPHDVCTIFDVCGGQAKVAVLPVITEGSQRIQRALFLIPASRQHPETVLLRRRTNGEIYFWLLSADGELQKTAYIQITGKSWVQMANSLARSSFDKDRQAWHAWVIK